LLILLDVTGLTLLKFLKALTVLVDVPCLICEIGVVGPLILFDVKGLTFSDDRLSKLGLGNDPIFPFDISPFVIDVLFL